MVMGRPELSFPAVSDADGGCRPARVRRDSFRSQSVPRCGVSPSRARISQCLLASLLDGASAHQRRHALRRNSLQALSRRMTLMRIGRADRRCRRFNGGQTSCGPGRRRRPKTGTWRFAAARRPPRPRVGFAKHDGNEAAHPSGCGHPCVPWRPGPIPGCRSHPSGVRPAETRCESHNRTREWARAACPDASVGRQHYQSLG